MIWEILNKSLVPSDSAGSRARAGQLFVQMIAGKANLTEKLMEIEKK